MSKYQDMSADVVLRQILQDGAVDREEVVALQAKIDQDWVVDRREIEFLFRVNRGLGERDRDCPEWTDFFVDNLSRLLIEDLDSPGEIDESEGNWLAKVLALEGVGNLTEGALLKKLRKSAHRIAGRITSTLGTGTGN